MSWFRRLFSGGGEAARWQKLLAASPGEPHVDLLVSVLRSEEAAIGPMARFALGCGLLAHELLEEKLGGVTSSLQGPQKAAVERGQARLWLQTIERDLKNGATLHGEWRPAADFGEAANAEAHKRTVQHVDRALKRVYGSGPGEGTLGRWLKALATEVGPLAEVDRSGKGGLPPSLSMADADVRAAHFDQVAFVDKVRAAQVAFVVLANRLAEAFSKGAPEQAALTDALGGKLEEPTTDAAAVKARWTTWQQTTRDATMNRGRNPKPAFAEDGSGYQGGGASEQRLASITKVMSLSDLPPESDPTSAPPLPEASGPVLLGMPPVPPNVTQEISVAQIESESRAFQSPPMTQEVSVGQIEQSDAASFAAPALTQEVSAAQLLESAALSGLSGSVAPPAGPPNAPPPPNSVTQPISAADIDAANAEDATRGPPPAPMTDPPQVTQPTQPVGQAVAAPTAPVSAEGAAVAASEAVAATVEGNGATNGVHAPETTPAPKAAQPGEPEPPRE